MSSATNPVAKTRATAKTTAKALAGLVVGLVILGVWLYAIGIQDTLATLTTVIPLPALLATLAWTVSLLLRSYKWHRILLSTQPVPFHISGRVYWLASFLNVLFPFRVGELARSLFLKRLADMPISASLPTVLVDRLYSIAVILVGLLFLPLTPFQFRAETERGSIFSGTSGIRWGVGLVAAAFLITLILLFALRQQKQSLLRLGKRVLFFLPQRLSERLFSFADLSIDSIQFVRSDAGSIVGLLAWSWAVLVTDAVKDHFVLQAFGLNVPVATCFFGACLTNLAFVLPSPPGNIGSNEWYATLVYSAGFGYPSVPVASGALFGHLMTTLIVALAGALSLSSLGITLAEGLRISRGEVKAGSAAPGP